MSQNEALKIEDGIEEKMKLLSLKKPNIAIKDQSDVLRKVSWMKGVSEEEIMLLSDKLDDVWYKTGDVILEEGAACDGLYLLTRGMVRVESKTEKKPFVRLVSGQMFGGISMLTGNPNIPNNPN